MAQTASISAGPARYFVLLADGDLAVRPSRHGRKLRYSDRLPRRRDRRGHRRGQFGQYDVSLFRELSDVEVAGAELECRRDRVLLVGGAVAGSIEVYPVRTNPLSSARRELQTDLGI